MIGRVVSNKMMKTVSVLVDAPKTHPLYKKTYMRSKKYLVDDPIGVAEGDVVEMIKVRPISKNKHWRITKVVGKDLVAIGEEVLAEAAQSAIEEVLPTKAEETEQLEETVAEAAVVMDAKAKKAVKKAKKVKKEVGTE